MCRARPGYEPGCTVDEEADEAGRDYLTALLRACLAALRLPSPIKVEEEAA